MAISDVLIKFLLSFMLLAHPPIVRGPISGDAYQAEVARYTDIARDAATVAFDPNEPPLYKDVAPRVRTALLLLSIDSSESQFRADVDAGKCREGECDGGTAVGGTQVHPGQGITLIPGAGYRYDRHGAHAADLIQDRVLLFRVTLHMARDSFAQCGNLSAFTSGLRCPEHEKKAEWREHVAKHFFETHQSPVNE